MNSDDAVLAAKGPNLSRQVHTSLYYIWHWNEGMVLGVGKW